jgi:hypothetical protein
MKVCKDSNQQGNKKNQETVCTTIAEVRSFTKGLLSSQRYRALRDLFCFAVLSGNAAKNFTCFKSVGRTYELEAYQFFLPPPGVELVVAGYPFSPRFLC